MVIEWEIIIFFIFQPWSMTKTVGKQWIFPVFRRLYVEMQSSADKKMSPGKDVKCLWCIFFCACEKCGKCVWNALYTNSEQTWKSYRLFSFAILILAEQALYYNENRSFLFVLIWHIVTVHSVLSSNAFSSYLLILSFALFIISASSWYFPVTYP